MCKKLLILCVFATLVSCSLEERLATTEASVQRKFDSLKSWEDLPLRKISWQQALAMIDANNTEIRRAKSSISSAERSARSVYTDLIPGVSYYTYFNNTIDDWIKGSTSDGANTNLNVTFSVPTLTQIPYRVYSTQATLYAAEKSLEGKHRECAVRLYKAIRKQEVSERIKKLNDQTSYNLKKTSKDRSDDIEREATFWQEMATVLGNRDARWYIDPSTMPRVKWADYKEKVKTLDPLVLCEFAMKIEQARLRQFSVALTYLPTVNTNLSSPSLFTSSGGTYSGTFLDSGDTYLNLNISYTFDTDLSTWNSYKTNQENFELTCLEVTEALADRRVKLKTLMRSVEDYAAWLSYMEKRIAYERRIPLDMSESYLDQNKKLIEMEREVLTQEMQAIESEVALASEYGFVD